MAEQVVATPATPDAQSTPVPSQPTKPVETPKEPDLVTRVSQFKKPETTTTPKPEGDVDFDFKELENMPPEAKTYAEKAYKSLQSGFNKKFQEVASLRKSLEKQLQDNTEWTPEKIQNLLNDPKFVQAAQHVAQTKAPSTYEGTDQEWSSLSEQEKAKFQRMENELSQLKQQNIQAEMKRQDEQLKNKYANYAPDVIDTTLSNLMEGKYQATREDIWKVIDYEDGMKRAYELGRQDERQTKQEKSQSISIDGSTVNHTKTLSPESGEKDLQFFKRAFLERMNQFGNKK